MKSEPTPHDTLWVSLNKLRQLFSRREKIGFIVLLLGMFGQALLETFSIGVIPVFLNLVMDPEQIIQHQQIGPVLSSLGITTQRTLLFWGSIVLIAILLVKSLYVFLYKYLENRYLQNRYVRLTERLFTAYMNAPYEFHLNRNTSELLRNIIQEVNGIVYHVLWPFLTLTMQGVLTLALAGLLIVSEPLFALIAIVLFGLAGGGYELLLKSRLRASGIQAQTQRSFVVKTLQQGLGALKEVRILRREAYFPRILRQSLRKTILANRLSNMAGAMTTPYMEFLAIAGLLGVAIAMVALGRDLQAIAAALVLFAAVFIRLKTGVAAIVSSFTSLRFNTVSINPVYKDLKQLEKVSSARTSIESPTQGKPVGMQQVLSLENIWYRYPGATVDALKDVNVTISRGEAVAFVGPTGAGKTTIVDIILGLLEPQRGQVIVDGKNIYDDLPAWQRTIGYIPQFIYLTDDTIRRNVALGLEDDAIDEAQVWRAVRSAQLEQFVKTLPDGLDTVVGERGVRLSGGQRQRIGIARALYHDPDVLIMDEATAALDNATEKEVMSAVNASKGERTLIMIAHRLTTVKECDRLYFMQDGRIESVGTYDELLETQSEFQMMAQ